MSKIASCKKKLIKYELLYLTFLFVKVYQFFF